MSGSGGSSKSEVRVPGYIKELGKAGKAYAEDLNRIGYMPYYGPSVAALAPEQRAAVDQSNQWADAFGLASGTGAGPYMPAPQQFAGGVQGYSAIPLLDQALASFAEARPAQSSAFANLFMNPTGAAQAPAQQIVPPQDILAGIPQSVWDDYFNRQRGYVNPRAGLARDR